MSQDSWTLNITRIRTGRISCKACFFFLFVLLCMRKYCESNYKNWFQLRLIQIQLNIWVSCRRIFDIMAFPTHSESCSKRFSFTFRVQKPQCMLFICLFCKNSSNTCWWPVASCCQTYESNARLLRGASSWLEIFRLLPEYLQRQVCQMPENFRWPLKTFFEK